ncbi:MAG: serine/threonine-protein kinase [Polyangia bacterium]|jgi:serine/threonine-protein kinase
MSTSNELAGSRLGPYRIVQHIATGGMAEIFLAHHQGLGDFKKELVLKVLQTRWQDKPEVVDMFLGEARLSALMDHPNIVDVYDVAHESGRHFIVMEHIAGKTLTELATRAIAVTKSIPVEVGTFISAEIAGALAYIYGGTGAHEPLRVVHRDVSPTNILVSTAGQVKLIDFGIARQGNRVIGQDGLRAGKVTYMSPEQVKGEPIDGRSDIFCLGTILYELTLGRRLWRGPRDVAVRRIVEERPKPPTFVRKEYPPELELIVMRALEKRAEDRYQSAADLHSDLHNFLEQTGAHLRHNCQLADYLAKIFSEEADALISDDGRRKAQAFAQVQASEEGGAGAGAEEEDLDFDVQQIEGPGAALARALRTSALGVWADIDHRSETGSNSSAVAEDGKGGEARSIVPAPAPRPHAAHNDPPAPARHGREAAEDNGGMAERVGFGRARLVGIAAVAAALLALILWLMTRS